jgi:hypothetical protein
LKTCGHKKESAGAALKRCELEKLKSRPRMEICKESRKSFNNTKNNSILPLDRILGFSEIYYHGLDTDYAGFRRGLRGKTRIKIQGFYILMNLSVFQSALIRVNLRFKTRI